MPGKLRLCAGCVAVPGHQPPSRLGEDGQPVAAKTGKPVLLAITADANTKANRFASAGPVGSAALQRLSFDFFREDDKEIGDAIRAKKLQASRSGWLLACLLVCTSDCKSVSFCC